MFLTLLFSRGQVMDAPLTVKAGIADIRAALRAHREAGRRIGVVPTMGALHEGHLSLMRTARPECDVLVNPTQFAPGEDFEQYPRPLEHDLELCRSESVDLVFTPADGDMYPAGFQTHVEVEQLSRSWEGAHRPSHFQGVTTVVLKLFNILQPDVAYFGQKDYQQQLLIRRMCRDLNVPVEIRTCETVRESDGLALSSRNAYLSNDQRARAVRISESLRLGIEKITAGADDLAAVRREMHAHLSGDTAFDIDYVTIVDADTLEELETPRPKMVAIAAARLGSTRLIDNMLIPPFTLDQLNSTE
jgi:pantoate--beta-alanine ligase